MMRRPFRHMTLALAALMLLGGMAYADDDATSLSYISYLERYVTLHPAYGDETLEAVVNMPVLAGDRLETARGARAEVQLPEGATIWVDEFTTMDFDAIAYSREDPAPRTGVYLAAGAAVVEIPDTAIGEGSIRVESPAGAVFLNRAGLYRLDLRQGQLHVQAFSGLAELPAGAGSTLLRGGQEALIFGDGTVQKASLDRPYDDFWRWVEARRSPAPDSRTARHVDARDAGRAAVLDSYGDWVYVDSFSTWMWRPHVSVAWSPYTYGRWYWTPVGWTWISYQPWGWYPFHYGSWYMDASVGWVWSWDWVWGPAWVHWIYTPGYVGWCPRGYYDYWYWNNHRTAWDWRRYPNRWGDVTLSLRGRVHLRDIDPRPWNFVPTRDFTNSRLSRARVDSRELLRRIPGNPSAVVRSGPLLTPSRDRGQIERTFDTTFRGGRDVPDVTGILRRDTARSGGGSGTPGIRTVATRDLASHRPDGVETSPRLIRTDRGRTDRAGGGGVRTPVTPSETGRTRTVTPRSGVTTRTAPRTTERGRSSSTTRSEPRTVRPPTSSRPTGSSSGSSVRPVTPSSRPSSPTRPSGGSTSRPATPPTRSTGSSTSRPQPAKPPEGGRNDLASLSRTSVRSRVASGSSSPTASVRSRTLVRPPAAVGAPAASSRYRPTTSPRVVTRSSSASATGRSSTPRPTVRSRATTPTRTVRSRTTAPTRTVRSRPSTPTRSVRSSSRPARTSPSRTSKPSSPRKHH